MTPLEAKMIGDIDRELTKKRKKEEKLIERRKRKNGSQNCTDRQRDTISR